MADAVGAVDGREVNGLFEIVELAGGAADVELILSIDEGYAGGVVAAVFQAAQAIQKNGERLTAADIANDSAHTCLRCK
jgi:hypothetical protein